MKRETKDRDNKKVPEKASPYHNPQHKNDLEKIALQSGKVNPADVGIETSVPDDILMPKPAPQSGPPQDEKKKKAELEKIELRKAKLKAFQAEIEAEKKRMEAAKKEKEASKFINKISN